MHKQVLQFHRFLLPKNIFGCIDPWFSSYPPNILPKMALFLDLQTIISIFPKNELMLEIQNNPAGVAQPGQRRKVQILIS